MAAALPVVRLSVVDQSRVVVSSDPKTASFTLYSFLKSVPTQAECHNAFHDLKRHVLASEGDAYSNSFIRQNAPQQRYLNEVENAAFTVFGRPPTRVFQVPEVGDASDVRRRTVDAFFRERASAPSPRRALEALASSSSHPRDASSPTSSYHPQAAVESAIPAAIPAAMHITGGGGRADSSAGSVTLTRVLEAVREQVHPEQDLDRNKRTKSGKMRNSGIDILTRLQQLISSEEEGSDVAVAGIRLQERTHSALVYRKLQDHEQETLRVSHMALHTEVAALKIVLRDVMKCVVRSEARLTGEDSSLPPTDQAYVAEHRLFEDVQDTLTQN